MGPNNSYCWASSWAGVLECSQLSLREGQDSEERTWPCRPVSLELGRLKQEDPEFKNSPTEPNPVSKVNGSARWLSMLDRLGDLSSIPGTHAKVERRNGSRVVIL